MGNWGGFSAPLSMSTWWSCCLLLLFQAVLGYSQNQSCDSNDLSALRGFLKGLDFGIPGWSLNESSSSCCNWSGVRCDSIRSRRVIGLDLYNMSLKGSISDSLAGLDQLKSLNLSSNLLQASVPQKLFHLPRLELLDLSLNNLSGSIPSDLSLPSIRVFNISDNSFTDSHPILAGSRNLTKFDVSANDFSGAINPGICNSSSRVQVLSFSMNKFSGGFPVGFGNCRSLVELSLAMNRISGTLPDDLFTLSSLTQLNLQENSLSGPVGFKLGNLTKLVQLDVSSNSFWGPIPDVFDRLTKLECFSGCSNNFTGSLPASLSNSSMLSVLNLRNNFLRGGIHLNFTALARLSTLDLGSNLFSGLIPYDVPQCVELKTINLARNNLAGEIPHSFQNFVALSYLSLTGNNFSNISSALQILQSCPNLTSLVLTKNFQGGEIMPSAGIEGFQKMEVLVIANCLLSGSIPPWLANSTRLKVLDISWNHLGGNIPSWLGNLEYLFYLDISNNSLTGQIPDSLSEMKSLISSNVTQQGFSMPDFPFYIKRNSTGKGLQYNQVSSFPPSLILCHNKLVGPILPGFGNLVKLHVLDLSWNNLSGIIPEELAGMLSLEYLGLSHNNLSGSIPSSLTKLSFLSSFNVAYNNLVGKIPMGGQFLTFSSDDFIGNPGLCGIHLSPCSPNTPSESVSRRGKNKGVVASMALGIGLGTVFILTVIYFAVSRTNSRRQEDNAKVVADADESLESAGSSLVLLFQNKDNKGLSINDIIKATNNFDQTYIIGCGGFGLVYKATLPDGRKVAIKRLSGDYFQMEREFQAEVQALSKAQHGNLVLLQGYCKIGYDRLLIYSYMENGSLDYWLHEKIDGGAMLDWRTRLRIAQGAARGLAYLHQSCDPHILHRDIKSSNILLDENFEAHLADFGLARLILPYDTHVTTDLVGTLGYIPPEYGQSSVATFKGDVYSFGVVLLELLTGRRPVDMCKPKGSRNVVPWALQMKKEKREAEVFDPCIYDKEHDSQLIKVLEIASLCVSESPRLRPPTQQLVAWLDNIGTDGQPTK
ncbi:phytosulfokine receptor 1-like [Phoenix dactylifera]|uniref:non-specific serine/threonine protein kinase n=1 Tax=Phoenix dactylifera TaxID=42345 RepID=A0A8B8JAB4_PHODC|nr:phytosulfokine receptor 1-like [Phoenix dactylifera]